MADTAVTTVKGNVIQVTFTGSGADWYIDKDLIGFEAGLRLNAIVFKPNDANDVLAIRNSKTGLDTDPVLVIWKVGGDTEEQVIYLDGENYFPFIDISACSITTKTSVYIHFHIK